MVASLGAWIHHLCSSSLCDRKVLRLMPLEIKGEKIEKLLYEK